MFAIIATVSAQEPQNANKPAMKPAIEKGYMRANPQDLAFKLTPDQKKQIADFKLAHDKEMVQINNLLGEKKAQLKTLLQTEKPDIKKINAKIDEITDLQNQKMKLDAQHKCNVRSILTDEQKVRMDMMMEHHPNGQGAMMARGKALRENSNARMMKKECANCKEGKECTNCKEGQHKAMKSESCCKEDSVKVIKVNKVK